MSLFASLQRRRVVSGVCARFRFGRRARFESVLRSHPLSTQPMVRQRCIHTPRFLRSGAFFRTGRRVIFLPLLSSRRASPGKRRNWSRTGFGKTIRPALSIVSLVIMDAILKWQMVFVDAFIGRPSGPFILRRGPCSFRCAARIRHGFFRSSC